MEKGLGDGRFIYVDMTIGTPIFQGCWGTIESGEDPDLIYARHQMMAILLGFADPVEF